MLPFFSKVILLYLSILALLFFFQRDLMYFPQYGKYNVEEIPENFQEVLIETEDGINSNSPYFTNRQYWLNHIEPTDQGPILVANSNFGAKCKVEIISKSELLRARGYKIGDLSITATQTTTTSSDLPELDLEDTPEEEETTTTSA